MNKNKKRLYTGINSQWKDFRLDDLGGKINEDNYHSNAVDEFIKKNEGSKHPPRLKLFGESTDSKFLNISYDALRQISKILKKMKI